MIALGGPKLKLRPGADNPPRIPVSMIALGGPKLKLRLDTLDAVHLEVSMIALGGPKLKLFDSARSLGPSKCLNHSIYSK